MLRGVDLTAVTFGEEMHNGGSRYLNVVVT